MGLASEAKRTLSLTSHKDIYALKLKVWTRAERLDIITRTENRDPTFGQKQRREAWAGLVEYTIRTKWLAHIPEEEWWDTSPGSKYNLLSRMLQKWMNNKNRRTEEGCDEESSKEKDEDAAGEDVREREKVVFRENEYIGGVCRERKEFTKEEGEINK